MRINKNIRIKILIYVSILVCCISESAGQNNVSLDSSDYIYLDSTISRNIKNALYESKIESTNEIVLFSIRFNIDLKGKIVNLQGSAFAPVKLTNFLQYWFDKNNNIFLVKIAKKGNLNKNLIVLPIFITPKIDTPNIARIGNSINVEMMSNLFLFSRSAYRKSKKHIYYYWYSPFSGIVLSPLTYPYIYNSHYSDKLNKYYKVQEE